MPKKKSADDNNKELCPPLAAADDTNNFCWAVLPGAKSIMWPCQLLEVDKVETVNVYCKSDNSEFQVKSSDIVPFLDNYQLKECGTKFLTKKKKHATLSCFLSDIKWIEEVISKDQPSDRQTQPASSQNIQKQPQASDIHILDLIPIMQTESTDTSTPTDTLTCIETPDSQMKPETPDSQIQLETPDIQKPQTPDIQKPETPDIQKPETPDIQKPETLDIQIPETPDIQMQPATPDIQIPETPDIQMQPATPDIQIPETPDIQIPEIPDIQIPEAPDIQMQPATPDIQMQPATPDIQIPATPDIQIPETPDIQMQPATPDIQIPETPDIRMPETPDIRMPSKTLGTKMHPEPPDVQVRPETTIQSESTSIKMQPETLLPKTPDFEMQPETSVVRNRSSSRSKKFVSYSDSDSIVSFGSEYVPESDEEISHVSGSYSSDDSEIFPMLATQVNSQKPDSGNIVDDMNMEFSEHFSDLSGDNEDVIETDITRADDINDIYVKKILKDSTTKSGKKKKVNRVYNSYQFCALCKIKVSNFAQHISRNRTLKAHANCSELTELLKENDKNRMCELRTLLRAKFNHKFNMKTIKRGKGELILERRPKGNFKVTDFGPCPGCYLWMTHKLLRKHKGKCLAKSDFSNLSSLVTQSKVITGRIQTEPSDTLLKEVFSVMKMDNIGTVAREDPLIVQRGNYWMQKNVGNKLKRGAYTSQIMRLCARLLINLREYPIQEPSLWNYLKPSHLDNIIKATLKVADAISDDNLQKPSNARKLGFYIKRVVNCKIGIAIMNCDDTSRKEAEDLLKTLEIFWGTRVAKLSNVLLEERKYQKHQPLPKPEDIAALNKHIESTICDLDLSVKTNQNFMSVVEAISAKLVVYNRRRVGEIEAIRLTDYENRRKGEAPEHLVGELTDFEKKLLSNQEVMTVRGKTGRGVPIILPQITKDGLNFLCDRTIRNSCGIQKENPYIFAGKENGVVRAYNCLAKACSQAPLSSPELITSTTLRKYMATITQVLDLKPNEMTWVLDHLGHSMDVHKVYYRATSEILEKTQIAKLLLIQDTNQVGRFKDKSLSDVQMEDVVYNPETDPEPVQNFPDSDSNLESEDDEPRQKTQRKRPPNSIKLKWTLSEEEEIKVLFKKQLDAKKRPTPAECLKALNISKRRGGVLWKRKKDVLKKKTL